MTPRYNVLIIEDELPAQANLRRALEKRFEELDIVGLQSSVRGTVEWLQNPDNHADIIFMDVELSDGMCFDIFEQVEVKAKVVITTAFDNYAVRAFRTGSIDYLLNLSQSCLPSTVISGLMCLRHLSEPYMNKAPKPLISTS